MPPGRSTSAATAPLRNGYRTFEFAALGLKNMSSWHAWQRPEIENSCNDRASRNESSSMSAPQVHRAVGISFTTTTSGDRGDCGGGPAPARASPAGSALGEGAAGASSASTASGASGSGALTNTSD